MKILQQLAELFLQAAPVAAIVLLFYSFLRANLFGPLEKMMARRAARIEGARREAESSQAAAKEKTRIYLESLKHARAEIYAEQEAIRKAALDDRTAAVRDARNRATEQIRIHKQRIAQELALAREQLERDAHSLGQEIAQAMVGQGVQ